MRPSGPIVLFTLALTGCSSCESGGPVPFGLDAGAPRRGDAVLVDRPSPTRPALVAQALPDGTSRAEVEGASLEITGESLRAIAAWDLDRDGDRDAIAITGGGASHGPRILVALRDGAVLGAPREIATSAALDSGCTISRAALRGEGDALVIAEVDARCPEDELGATMSLHAFAISAEALPRTLEGFRLRARERDGGGHDAITLRAADQDGDGHPDLVVDLSFVVDGSDALADVSLAFLDRPAGLARDPGEPEARIAALAGEARTSLRRHADRARATTARALTLRDALCREPGRARLEVGGTAGIACGRSAGAGRALAISVQAAARTGDPLAALAAWEQLSAPQVQVRDADRTAARAAVEGLVTSEVTSREGPLALAPSEPMPRLGALAFLDEDRLLIRGASPRIVALAGGTEMPAGDEHAGLAMSDPSRAHHLVAIERRCEGSVLVIAPSDAMAEATGARTTALLAARRAPSGATCPDLTPVLRGDADRWVALGWAPQGVLVARDRELRVVPLDLEGRAAGAPSSLEAGAAVPAPIAPGHATSDVRAWAYSTAFGIVVVDLAGARTTSFVRPTDWSPPEGASIDVAISPSGQRIAWIAGGHVRWIERATPSP